MVEIHWGLLVAAYLFLAGAGAGALFISSYYVLSDKIKQSSDYRVAGFSSLAGVLLLIAGTTMIILDLTTFRAGIAEISFDKFFRFLNFFKTFIPGSMMSIGSWLVSIAIVASMMFAYAFIQNSPLKKHIKTLAALNMLLSMGVASYTALLLGDIAHNFVWSNSLLVVLFMVSALSSGIAVVMLMKVLTGAPADNRQSFEKSDAAILTFELVLLSIFAYALVSMSAFNDVEYPLLLSSIAGQLWWFGALALGVVIPLLMNLKAIFSKTALSHSKECLLSIAVLAGAFSLRYSVLLAGQYY